MAKRDETIRIVELNNKSRRGQYIYFRRGRKSYYYKIRPGYTVEQILRYRRRKQNKHKPLPKKKEVKIAKILKSGITQVTTEKPEYIKTLEINRLKRRLLEGRVSRRHMKLLTQEQNFNKLRTRLEYVVTFYDNKGLKLGEATRMNIGLERAIKELKESVTEGEETATFETSPTIEKLKKKGWNTRPLEQGRIAKTKLRVILRKR